MSRLIRKASSLMHKGKNNAKDSQILDDTTSTMPSQIEAIASVRQPRSIDLSLRAAEIAHKRRLGADSTGGDHWSSLESYGISQREDHATRRAIPLALDSTDVHNSLRGASSTFPQIGVAGEEIIRMHENALASIGEESDTPAETVQPQAPSEQVPTPEPDNHAEYVLKHAYEWPGNPDDRLALRRLRLAAFRDFQNRKTEPRRLTWQREAEISIGGEMLFGGNCLADVELFEHYGDRVRQLKPSEKEDYQQLYGFFPEETKRMRDNKDLILSINRAASASLKAELYEHEIAPIRQKVMFLRSMAEVMGIDDVPGTPNKIEDRRRDLFRWCVANIELHWGQLMDLAAKRGQLNNEILEAVARGDVLQMLVLAGHVTIIGMEG